MDVKMDKSMNNYLINWKCTTGVKWQKISVDDLVDGTQ